MLLVVIAGGALYALPLLSGQGVSAPEPRAIAAYVTVEKVLPEVRVEIPASTTALELLTSLSEQHGFTLRTKEYVGLGSLVELIGMYENGMDGKYWQYYVNGALAPVGASAYEVHSGDIVVWKFTIPDPSL